MIEKARSGARAIASLKDVATTVLPPPRLCRTDAMCDAGREARIPEAV
jgi:hypothetical protein